MLGRRVSTLHGKPKGPTASAAAFDDGINDSAALTRVSATDEEPVLFSKSGWADGVFHQIIVSSLLTLFRHRMCLLNA